MSISIKNKFASLSRFLSISNNRANLFLYIGNWNISLKWFFFRTKSSSYSLWYLVHIKDCITLTLWKNARYKWFSGKRFSDNNSVFNFVTEFFIEKLEAPFTHCLKSEFFLEKRFNVEKRKLFVVNFNCWAGTSWINDCSNFRATCFKLLYLVNLFWEIRKNKFIDRNLTTINDFVEHSYNQVSWNLLVSFDDLDEFLSNNGISFHLGIGKIFGI